MLYLNRFRIPFLTYVYSGVWYLMFPSYWALNMIVAVFIRTTVRTPSRREETCYEHFLYLLLIVPVYGAILLITAPVALLALLLWFPLQFFRRPYLYSYRTNKHNTAWCTNIQLRHSISLATINACLMPEAISKMNNLKNSKTRGVRMGKCIVSCQTRQHIQIFVESPSELDNEQQSWEGWCKKNPGMTENSSDSRKSSDTRAESNGDLSQVSVNICKESSSGTDSDATDSEWNPLTEKSNSMAGSNGPVAFDSSNKTQESNTSTGTSSRGGGVDIYSKANQAFAGTVNNVKTFNFGNCPSSPAKTNLEVNKLETHHNRHKLNAGDDWCTSSVISHFPPDLDFICCQEVFDYRIAKLLTDRLHEWFEHVVYDVGIWSWKGNHLLMNSGLAFASRYPILDCDFKAFNNCVKEDSLACKGLLMVKVQIGESEDGRRIVGYINNTHLQSLQEYGSIRTQQMNSILDWCNGFFDETRNSDEIVSFYVLCGDLNFDTMSACDRSQHDHELFKHFIDPCRNCNGEDHPWTVGTEMIQRCLYEDEVSTPDGLHRILLDDDIRGSYIEDIDTDNEEGLSDSNTGRRRIDYILYNNSRLTDNIVCNVEEYNFVTQLATLTDHIPIRMKLSMGPTASVETPSVGVDESCV